MAIEPLVPTFVDGRLVVMRGDRYIVDQPFFPATGNEPRRDWVDEQDALDYWESVKDQYATSGLTSEELDQIYNEQQETANT